MLEEFRVAHFGIRVLVLLATDRQAINLAPEGRAVAAIEDLCLEGNGEALSRLLISLTAQTEPVSRTAGQAKATQGTAGRCSQRLSWSGDVPFGEETGTPGSSSQGPRAGGYVTTRLVREAGAAEWRLCVLPLRIRNLTINARVEQVEDVTADLEAAFGVPLQGT